MGNSQALAGFIRIHAQIVYIFTPFVFYSVAKTAKIRKLCELTADIQRREKLYVTFYFN